ncbi:unnamed protein product [Musa acuminata subsp. malaccensis]|uniref:Citrate synthase n=1 Tax=Musa acuminata subsp. malaccensis TaxID=214687 RepID=A0A8D7AJ89_MUSAM|nr:unnamed protein product [Musa acuminata subsp. malaccensis]
MCVLVSALSALSVFHPDAYPALRGQDLYNSKHVRDKQIVRALGKVPTIAASAYLRLTGGPPVLPSNNFSYSENFLYMLDSLSNRSYVPIPRLSRVLDILFILHAEHEMNCSTAAVRHLASRYIGPLHGGANEQMGNISKVVLNILCMTCCP